MLRRRRIFSGGLLLFAMAAAGALPTPAAAEPAKAGPFYKSGMQAMWDIGLLLPFDRDAQIRIQGCQVTPQKAVCGLRVSVTGLRACKVTAILQKRRYTLPAALWGCPGEWWPIPPDWHGTPTERLVLRKATSPAR